jgi:hypothetical protein
MGPYPYSGSGYLPTSTTCKVRVRAWQDKVSGLEPHRIGKGIIMVLCIVSPAP